MRKFKLLTLLAVALMTANMWAGTAIEGTGLEWELTDGTLTITYTGEGTAAMPDYNLITKQPWKSNRGDITAIVIGNGVTAIGRNNFASCTNLETVTYNSPCSVTSIGQQAFQNCSTMVSITIPSGVTSIGNNAFNNCSAVNTAVTIPASVTSIGTSGFNGCSSMPSITLNEGLQTIGQQAFQNCDALTNITIPASVTSISARAFQSCEYLVSLTFAGTTPCSLGATILGSDISYGCPHFAKINVPDAASATYASAFAGYWDYLYETTSGDHVDPLTWTSGACNLEFAALGTMTISGPGAMADYADASALPWTAIRSFIKKVVIENGVTAIGAHAFDGCSNLASIVTSSATPPTLGTDAFNGYSVSLEISGYACANEAAYKSAWSGFSPTMFVEDCGEPANSCGGGLTWEVSGTVLTISYNGSGTGVMYDYAETTVPWYSSRSSITSIVMPEGMTHIGNHAFHSCSNWSLTSITIPSTVTSIGDYAFYSCSQATSINIPSGVSSIGDAAFSFCSGLTSLSLPSGLTSLGAQAFSGCSKIASEITIPSGITALADGVFSGCNKIPSVTLPSGVTSIGSSAFMMCYALTEVTIPASVTEIGVSAFSQCTALETVHCLPTTAPTLGNNAFYNHPENLIIYYPNGANEQDYSNKFLQYWDYLRNASTSARPSNAPHLSGTFSGGTLTWDLSFTGSGTLMEHDGTLAITGTGAMDDYDWMNNEWAPWFYYNDFINHVNIASGVTKIGESAFANMEHVNTFIIPASVIYIGGDAFMGCNNPEMIVYCYANPATLEWHDNTAEWEAIQSPPDDFLSLTRSPWGTYTWHVQATKCVVPEAYLEEYKTNWARGEESPEHYKDVNVWFASELQDGETESAITTKLNELDGHTAPVVTLVRPLNRNGYFATLCLPFNMSAEQLAESSLHGAEIKEFTNASVNGGTLDIEFTPVSAIEAGKPYFVKFTDAELLGDALDRLDFMEVTIDKTAPVAVTHGGLTMTGTYVPKSVSVQTSATDGDGVLFLGANNQLFWPNVAGNIKPFRAYFSITGGGANNAPRRGMPARIVEKEQTTTALDNVHDNEVQCKKMIENGILIIEKNGVKYNAQGQTVK